MRHTRWTRVRIVGDKKKALQHKSAALTFLGSVIRSAQLGKLDVATRIKRLAPDVLVAVDFNQGYPILTITASSDAAATSQLEIPELYGFVIWPRTDALPDGVDADHPQIVLQPPSVRTPWTTWYFEEEADGWPDVVGKKRLYEEAYPNGLNYFGNVDWRGSLDTEGRQLSCSWYGLPGRYWGQAPSSGVQKYVFFQGQILLDTGVYFGANPTPDERLTWEVRGAAMRKIDGTQWLYVMHVKAALGDHALIRYPMVEPATSGDAWSLGDAYEIAWSATLDDYYGFWFFNASCTEASAILSQDVLEQRSQATYDVTVEGFRFNNPSKLYAVAIESSSAFLAETTALQEYEFLRASTIPDDSGLSLQMVASGTTYGPFPVRGAPCDDGVTGATIRVVPSTSIVNPADALEYYPYAILPPSGGPPYTDPDNTYTTVGTLQNVSATESGPPTQTSICAVDYRGNTRVFAYLRVSNLARSSTSVYGASMDAVDATQYVTNETPPFFPCYVEEICGDRSTSGTVTVSTTEVLAAKVELVIDGMPDVTLFELDSRMRLDESSTASASVSCAGEFLLSTSYSGDNSESSHQFRRVIPYFCDLRKGVLSLFEVDNTRDLSGPVSGSYSCADGSCDIGGAPGAFTGTSFTEEYDSRCRIKVAADEVATDQTETQSGHDIERMKPKLVLPLLADIPSTDLSNYYLNFTGHSLMWLLFAHGIEETISGQFRLDTLEERHLGTWLWSGNVVLWSQPRFATDEHFCGAMRAEETRTLTLLTGIDDNAPGAGYWPGWVLTRV